MTVKGVVLSATIRRLHNLISLTDAFEENPNPPVATLNYRTQNFNVRITGQRQSSVK